MAQRTALIVASSEHDANMLYATRMFVPDPFIFLQAGNERSIIISDLEIDRARREARGCEIISLSACQEKLRKQGVQNPRTADVTALVLKQKKIKQVVVPGNFPLALADQLRRSRVKVSVADGGAIFPERECKDADEVRKITEALRMAEVGLGQGIEAIRKATIGKKRELIYRGSPLTSERLRTIIDAAILEQGGAAERTITSGGKQACDPHEQGHGLLRAGQPIILDVFPRSKQTGYFGDITRTVVKGKATEPLRRLYATVLQGQKIGFQKLKAGVAGADIHRAIQEYFGSQGYETGQKNGRMQGFFHGTGHGVGLEIHEAPRIALTSPDIMKPGHVVTVEPGLYYPELGGVRLEDMAWVRERDVRNLTRFEKVFEI